MTNSKTISMSELDDKIEWLDRMITYGDKRRHPRRKVALLGDFVAQKGEKLVLEFVDSKEKAGVIDMSISGAGIVSERPMSQGQKFLLVCKLKSSRLKLDLQVVRHARHDKKFHYGCLMHACEKIA